MQVFREDGWCLWKFSGEDLGSLVLEQIPKKVKAALHGVRIDGLCGLARQRQRKTAEILSLGLKTKALPSVVHVREPNGYPGSDLSHCGQRTTALQDFQKLSDDLMAAPCGKRGFVL